MPPRSRRPLTSGLCTFVVLAAASGSAQDPPAADRSAVSIVHTGRSLGALGVLQDSDEHDLVLEEAARRALPVRLATRLCWRAPGLTVFSPDGDLTEDSLQSAIAGARSGGAATRHPALRSNNATLIADPDRRSPDPLALVLANPRVALDFPDLVESTVSVRRIPGASPDRDIIVVTEGDPAWPTAPGTWARGIVNRIDVGDATAYELAVNLGPMGSRATVLDRLTRASRAGAAATLLVDLGHRDGDLGLERHDRARVDYTALTRLGYRVVVPSELELALGAAGLAALKREFPLIRFFAANVTAAGEHASLFEPHAIVGIGGLQIGLFGLVDPDLRGLLAGGALADFTVEPPVDAAARAVAALRQAGADAVVMLSNLHPRDNALVAREVAGIDAIAADLHVRWSPEAVHTEVELPGRPATRPGSPALVARSFANGLGAGRLDLGFTRDPRGRAVLTSMAHELAPVTDREPPDAALVSALRTMARAAERPRGLPLVPDFNVLAARRPSLRAFDSTAALGRISKPMWEEALARLIRYRAGTEVALIRKLPHFPPAIGELYEADVRAWLWTEDAIVTLDLSGADLRVILAEDVKGDLVISGLDRATGLVHGRPIDDLSYYRVATTDLLLDGARFRSLGRGRRAARLFRTGPDGSLERDGVGQPLPIRTFVLGELARLRRDGATDRYLDTMARLLDRDPPFEPLMTFRFDRPTLFASANRVVNNEAYGQVPESRILGGNNAVFGATGRFVLSFDRQRTGVDLGARVAYAKQSTEVVSGGYADSETADDIKVDLTLRRKIAGARRQAQPFLRAIVDSEFTATVGASGIANPHELRLQGVGGLLLVPGPHWRTLEIGAVVEQDVAVGHLEFGARVSSDQIWAFGPMGRLTYRLLNDFTYLFPGARDRASDLSVRYDLTSEIQIPLADELALSVAADLFVFKGKVEETREPGASLLMRVGLTYDRLWKPRYQPLF
jgi:hypothetical protein